MEKILVTVFDSESQARAGSRALKELHADGHITLHGASVIAKYDAGKVTVIEAADPGPLGSFVGLFTGGLVGLLGGPVGAFFGVAGGLLLGSMYDFVNAGVSEDFLNQVQEYLLPGKAAVVAAVDEEWVLPVDTRLEAAGGVVFRQPVIDIQNIQIERELAALGSEIAAMKAERAQATGEAPAKLQVKIADAEAKLQAIIDRAGARIEAAERVADAKVQSLEEQAARAHGERKAWLQDRAAQLRTHYSERNSRLREACKLAQEALEPLSCCSPVG